MTTLTYNIAGVPCALEVESLPAETVQFALDYGFRQYLQDGAAVSKLFLTGDRKGEEKSPEEIAEEKAEGVRERLENLLSGTFTRRSAATKLSPEETIAQRIAVDAIEAAGKASNKKLPNRTGPKADKGWWETRIAAYLEKYADDVQKEVTRQMKQRAKVIDLDDILG